MLHHFLSASCIVSVVLLIVGCGAQATSPVSQYPAGFPQTAEALDSIWNVTGSAVMPAGPGSFNDWGKFHMDYDTNQDGTLSWFKVLYEDEAAGTIAVGNVHYREIYAETTTVHCSGPDVSWGFTMPDNPSDELDFILIQGKRDSGYMLPGVEKLFINGVLVQDIRPFLDIKLLDKSAGQEKLIIRGIGCLRSVCPPPTGVYDIRANKYYSYRS
jgi:hypothetical protein